MNYNELSEVTTNSPQAEASEYLDILPEIVETKGK